MSLNALADLLKVPKLKSRPGTFSYHFIDVDGNASNFDSLTVAIPQFKHNFNVISIEKTKADRECKNLALQLLHPSRKK